MNSAPFEEADRRDHVSDNPMNHLPLVIKELTPELKEFLNFIRNQLKGHARRQFMARVVSLLGYGGQIRAERELGWDRKTIVKIQIV
ncbi:MAG: hypothetical protein JW786_09085 [Desulfobacterales bacterium]|nr:hypothetical protein [Desulfobacterales bacterium]